MGATRPDIPIGGDSAVLLDILGRYRRDPGAVPADWRLHFETLDAPAATGGAEHVAALLVAHWRRHGVSAAGLDPLGLSPARPVAIDPRLAAAVAAQADTAVTVELAGAPRRIRLGELEPALAALYGGTAAIEADHVEDAEERAWLFERFEAAAGLGHDAGLAAKALETIALADAFETFMHVKFPTKKRFGSEGAESALVFVREVLRHAATGGYGRATIGGMHRGRMTMLAAVFGKSADAILAEIKDIGVAEPGRTGDVPYHLGHDCALRFGNAAIDVTVLPHPSHLITVAPVTLGKARGQRATGQEVMCLLMHSDAAFAGQGLVAEIMQLGRLDGYEVGGTIHLVVNNQIGFTTMPSEGRSARFCTDIGKLVGAPILHVNGDDPLAVARMAELAVDYRRRFGRDILIDLVCYRRNGHNELDEPRFTQPVPYEVIDARSGLLGSLPTDEAATAAAAELRRALHAAYDSIAGKAHPPRRAPEPSTDAEEALLAPVVTGLALDELRRLGSLSCHLPEEAHAHPKVAQFYRQRETSIGDGAGINIATAEALAFASLLAEGHSVRLSGQDSVRGTFSQRHLAVMHQGTGAAMFPLDRCATGGAAFQAINSPLSEYAVLGFEYGLSTATPDDLVMWEAQFGDFLNGAQPIIDQYVVSAEAKWGLASGVVIALPHGLEGQGPDHSSARIERLLQGCAGGNVTLANPSTPAQLFHLLRRQIVAPWRKPLLLIAPKSLLRLRDCSSHLDEMGPGTAFQPVIVNAGAGKPAKVGRIVLCSGKVYYDLRSRRDELGLDIPIIRVEQLYPFPAAALREALRPYPGADLVWCQEEAENQGAWDWVRNRLDRAVTCAARPAMAATAGGSFDDHLAEQASIVARALGTS